MSWTWRSSSTTTTRPRSSRPSCRPTRPRPRTSWPQITKDGNALVEQFKELDEQSKNPTATAEAKAKAQAEAQKKYDEIQQKRSEQNSFVQNTRNTLQQRFQTFKTLMIEEITKTAVEIAKKKGATFLLDKSGPTLVGVSNILYFDPSLDITDEVAAEINKDRPAVTPTPAARRRRRGRPGHGRLAEDHGPRHQ